ncbi:uncharacterized protein LACBIDRAFT_295555 [Laccaria bicolor S238N-H82]|uniref:Predicted protein n=1 Tax=Laccaria bicolor (strain S238N-H82 / ATCC MYA-4686) TaxID=486041 RepID=B0DUM9_LACBS|nr:uncharacterized protein LACBIDRAFT_295555 [Laccaria bicolor S238N-H82]EDR01567.1 predicted protein [Laccaria bicolor S238N-H82]|eukprot:XP_001887643.1 predicted protein [Laccaria bicolor S238N-H82]
MSGLFRDRQRTLFSREPSDSDATPMTSANLIEGATLIGAMLAYPSRLYSSPQPSGLSSMSISYGTIAYNAGLGLIHILFVFAIIGQYRLVRFIPRFVLHLLMARKAFFIPNKRTLHSSLPSSLVIYVQHAPCKLNSLFLKRMSALSRKRYPTVLAVGSSSVFGVKVDDGDSQIVRPVYAWLGVYDRECSVTGVILNCNSTRHANRDQEQTEFREGCEFVGGLDAFYWIGYVVVSAVAFVLTYILLPDTFIALAIYLVRGNIYANAVLALLHGWVSPVFDRIPFRRLPYYPLLLLLTLDADAFHSILLVVILSDLVNVVLDAAHVGWSTSRFFANVCVHAESTKRPLSFPLPATFQEGARKEGTMPNPSSSISCTPSDDINDACEFYEEHALCPRQLHELIHPLRSRPPVKSENCPGRTCDCGPEDHGEVVVLAATVNGGSGYERLVDVSSVLHQPLIVILSNPHHRPWSPALAKPSPPPPIGLSGVASSNAVGIRVVNNLYIGETRRSYVEIVVIVARLVILKLPWQVVSSSLMWLHNANTVEVLASPPSFSKQREDGVMKDRSKIARAIMLLYESGQSWWRGVREAREVKIRLMGAQGGAFEKDDEEALGTWSSQMVQSGEGSEECCIHNPRYPLFCLVTVPLAAFTSPSRASAP